MEILMIMVDQNLDDDDDDDDDDEDDDDDDDDGGLCGCLLKMES